MWTNVHYSRHNKPSKMTAKSLFLLFRETKLFKGNFHCGQIKNEVSNHQVAFANELAGVTGGSSRGPPEPAGLTSAEGARNSFPGEA
jgi:hypothetical protein